MRGEFKAKYSIFFSREKICWSDKMLEQARPSTTTINSQDFFWN